MNGPRHYTWLAIATVFAVCVTACTLGGFVTRPWHAIGELGSDGLKNSFTYLWQCMYGHGYWFQGMNYPYGEHIVYTDGQPILSLLLSKGGHTSAPHALAIMWWLIDLSYVLSILFVYAILRRFRVQHIIALLFAGLIVVYNPQLFRIQAHYALAYVCIVPMVFYWLIRYNDTGLPRYCIYLFIAGCLTAFLHLYYIAMMLIFVIGYAMGYFIFARDSISKKLKHALLPVASVLCIFAVVALVMKLTDPITDRPVTPYIAFYDTCTRLRQVVTSANSPFWVWVRDKGIMKKIADGGEGYVYLGLVVCVTLFVSVVVITARSIKSKRLDILVTGSGFSPIWLFVALFSLVVSMGIPFIWHPRWLDYLAVFKQFRSMGRFSWIFYYIATVYAVVVLDGAWKKMSDSRRPALAYGFIALAFCLWAYEASAYISFARLRAGKAQDNYTMLFSENEKNWAAFLKEQNHSSADFQAILALPFYEIGSEKIWVQRTDWINTLASKAALQLKLPIIDAMMSRTSWSQAFGQVRTVAGPYSGKPLLRDIHSDKPFLLLHFDEDTLSPDEQYLLLASDYIGHYSQCNIYACYPRRIAANDHKCADSINAVLPYIKVGDTSLTTAGSWYVQHFNNGDAYENVFGARAAFCNHIDSSLLADIPVHPQAGGQLYELSCWFLLNRKDPRSPDIRLSLLDSTGTAIDTTFAYTIQSVDNKGMWFRTSKYLWLKGKTTTLRCILLNKPDPTYYIMDELMLRPAGSTIISKDASGKVMVNNHVFKGRN